MKILKTIGKAFVVAFSIYSKIPMPRFTWDSEDMKYHLCFFPLVGVVIGALEGAFYWICRQYDLGTLFYVFIALAIPILITGGFHLDGFLDTCDALHSYQEREKKLEILKDPHIGAFSVICLCTYFLMMGGFLSVLYDGYVEAGVVAICLLAFPLARAFSGIAVVTKKGAKSKGMLQTFSETAVKNTVLTVLVIQVILCGSGMLFCDPYKGTISFLTVCVVYLYYGHMSEKQFGGITGDLAGYFVSIAELTVIMSVALMFVFF